MQPLEDKLKRLIFVTGSPGTGKTTILLKVAEELKTRGYKVGGMVSQEIREKGIRVGFEILDYASGRKGWLAHINQPTGPQVGKYRVNLKDLNRIGVIAILDALNDTDVVVIDEIGPMELLSESFKNAVKKAVYSSRPVLATVHYRAQPAFIRQVKARDDAETVEVTPENRNQLALTIVEKVVYCIKKC